MEEIRVDRMSVIADGPAGDFGNNIYLVVDRETNEAAFIDAPFEPEKSIALAESIGVRPAKILLTHSHADHTAGLARLREEFHCRLFADEREPWLEDGAIDVPVVDGQEINVGKVRLTALSVPGHTPGSTTFLAPGHAFVGDTLFPGGPGKSSSPEDLAQEIESITSVLFELPDDTVVWPGHGDATTIGESKAEYEGFAAREHDPGLHGDVSWETS